MSKERVKQWVTGSNPNQPLSWAWFKGLWNDWTGNSQIDKQLSAQKEENALSREWNLELAKQQNAWNREQWERENAYNSPAAQASRLKAAGLNPALMYGGVDNASASSPAMTSGSPYNPMDWSALGSKKTPLDVAAQMANVENIRATTEKIRSETEGIGIDNKYKDIKNLLGIELDKSIIKKNGKELEEMDSRIKYVQSQTANMEVDTINKIIDGIMRSQQMEHLVREAKAKADVAESDARVALKSEISRIAIFGYQASEADSKAKLADFQQSTAWAPLAIQAAQLGLNIFDTALKFKNLKDFFKSRPDLFPPASMAPPAGN